MRLKKLKRDDKQILTEAEQIVEYARFEANLIGNNNDISLLYSLEDKIDNLNLSSRHKDFYKIQLQTIFE